MVFDIEKHEKDRQKLLAALYEFAAEVRATHFDSATDPTVGGAHTYPIASSGVGRIAGWVGVYMAGVASGVSWRELARWVGHLLGR
jgi:hypothetical protein